MKLNRGPLFLLIIILLTSCGSSGGGSSTPPSLTLSSIAVTPSNPSIAKGMTQQLTARGTFSNFSTQDLTVSVVWSSSTPTVATISNAGLVTSFSTGTTTITAASGNITSNSVTLTVTAPALVSIEVTPSDPIISAPTTTQFTAMGTYSDSTNQDFTTSATWSSSAVDVATISSSGTVTGIAAGTTIIMAKFDNVSGSTTLTVTGGTPAPPNNVMPITVNGSLCSPATSAGYLNKPCVSVTVCTPGTATCQTINDILLDTGSYGLRIFSNATPTPLAVSLPAVTSGAGSLANCVQFADGSADWGPVKMADVVLGNEPAVTVPIQVIDATAFGTAPAACSTLETSPAPAGFNGILGVGLFAQDCGSFCVTNATSIYYSCSGTVCNPTTVPLSGQVTNPVVKLSRDNNGVIVQLPSVSPSGLPSVGGNLVFGIDTDTNNTSTGATMYKANGSGEIGTTFSGTTYRSIVDSGSNGLFFTASPSQLPICSSNPPWFCPSPSAVTLSAVNMGASGAPTNTVFFQIGNFSTLTNSSNQVFSNIGGFTSNLFDWGLPFYFGRNIYVGIEGKTSNLGTGPYFAY